MVNITIIGAGGRHARTLSCDIISFPELANCTISLMDVDPQRLEVTTQLVRKAIMQEGRDISLESTTDRRAALSGADYVLTIFQVGGLDAWKLDVEVRMKYGVNQWCADSLGPGGVFHALRTIPVLLDTAKDMEDLCPHALLLNYVNPMPMNCWAVSDESKITVTGICHGIHGTAAMLAGVLDIAVDELSYWTAGINHMAWFLKLRFNGRDLYPVLRENVNDPDIVDKDPVRFEIMRHFGYFCTESSPHMSDYVPYFR